MPSKRKGNWRARGTNAANTPRPPRAQDAPALVDDIADLGDIILVVGIEEKQRQLRVLSHMLRAASKTFAVMFGPVFQEGQGLDVNNPKSIPLPEDDAEAMEVLCRIIHLHNDSVSMTMSAEKVLSIARLVDKYALHRTVYLAATYWLDPTSTTDIKALGQLLVAADLMDHHRGFRNITENMVTRHTACFHHITSYHCEDDIWSRLCRFA
ncbi:hypothetical protein OHC33_007894 [Knufia fluminis]|uniref:BTB domain-containing protein n=1 Tax=Knufia fluminis TaxID=191047 RepID=A0AAN8I628_9EURO|nr:hypothetical protein OHC33_007894 [Knufia fluminis]